MTEFDMAKKVLLYQNSFGVQNVTDGRYVRPMNVCPTGVLALDLALGIGGWPSGKIVEVFGPPDVGKNLLMIKSMQEAQKLGMICGLVSVEGEYDMNWYIKHGCNPDQLLIIFPEDGETAFTALQKMAQDDDIDFIVFDSIGALQKPSEAKIDGKKAVGGQSGMITDGVKSAWQPAWRKNKYIILLNQIRDVLNSTYPTVDSPGGHLLKHAAAVRVQLKPREKYTIGSGDDKITVGTQVLAEVKRTKIDEGTGKRALWDCYTKETDKYPFGIDWVTDAFATAKRTGVIRQGGAWYSYEDFPDGKIQSEAKVLDWLRLNPESVSKIREKIVETIR